MAGERYLGCTAWAWLVLAALGIADTTYLTAKRFTGSEVNCFITDGCSVVAKSSYSLVLGVPLSLIGGLFFLAILVLAICYLAKRQPRFLLWGSWLAIPGMLIAWWYEYVQFYIIYAICIYCVMAAALSTLLCASGVWVLVRHKKGYNVGNLNP
jgi:uncharacterized membrane protein